MSIRICEEKSDIRKVEVNITLNVSSDSDEEVCEILSNVIENYTDYTISNYMKVK